MGTISDAVHLLHGPVVWLLRTHLPSLAVGRARTPADARLFAALVTALTIAVASISWFGFERPLNRLKERFPHAPA